MGLQHASFFKEKVSVFSVVYKKHVRWEQFSAIVIAEELTMAKRDMSAWQVDKWWGLLWASKLERDFPESPMYLQDHIDHQWHMYETEKRKGGKWQLFFSFFTPWRSVWNPGAVNVHINVVPGLLPHLTTWQGQLQHPLAPSFSSSKPCSSVCNSTAKGASCCWSHMPLLSPTSCLSFLPMCPADFRPRCGVTALYKLFSEILQLHKVKSP